MKKRLLIALLIIMLIGTMSLAGCGGTGDNETGGSDLKISISSDPQSLDPHFTMDAVALGIVNNICETLFTIDENGEEKMRLATEYEISDDGLVYTFKIQEGATFSNGTPCDAAAVAASFERAQSSPFMGNFMGPLKTVEATTGNAVAFTLEEPYSPFLRGVGAIPVVDADVAGEAGDEEFARNPIGCGPYIFDDWSAGEKVTLKSNPNYYDGAPAIETVEYRVIPNSSAALIAIENGEIDMAFGLEARDLIAAEDNSKLNTYEVPSIFIEYLYENGENEYYKDARVRRAVNMVIDKQAIIDVAFEGHALQADQNIGPTYFGFKKDFPKYERDVEGAKKLLAEAGYPDGFKTTITAMEGFRNQAAQIVQTNLAEIGIEAEIVLLDFGTMLSEGEAGNFDLYIMELAMTNFESYYIYQINYDTSLFGPGGNYARLGDKDLDAMLAEYKSLTDDAEKQALIDKMDNHIVEQGYALPLFTKFSNVTANAELKGVYADPLGFTLIDKISW